MHIHTYSYIFIHIHTYSCIFMHIHAYSYIFIKRILFVFMECSKRFQSLTGQEMFSIGGGSVTELSPELEALKAEILAEVRREINQAKQEIIDGEIQCFVKSTNLMWKKATFSKQKMLMIPTKTRSNTHGWITG